MTILRTGSKVRQGSGYRVQGAEKPRHCETPKAAKQSRFLRLLRRKTVLSYPPRNDGEDHTCPLHASRTTLHASRFTLHAAKGFTLIEVLMAISLLAVGMVGVLRAYSTSVNAMEIAQYNIDAACLLEAVMGGVEEQSVSQRGLSEGASEAAYGSSSDIKIDTTRSGRWQWNIEVLTTGLQAFEADSKTKPEKTVIYSLNEVKVTAVNPGRNPARRVSVVTYMEKYAES